MRKLKALLFLVIAIGCGKPNGDFPIDSSSSASPALFVPPTNMIAVKAGDFIRNGTSVSVDHDFWLGKFEVTQAEFSRVMGRNPSHFQGDENRPVEKISYLDAEGYCKALTEIESAAGRLPSGLEYRLPTEAEWELACLAGSTNRFSFGNSPDVANEFAWTAENSDGTSHPVGRKTPNDWGFYDMHGNVWEWCSDWFTAPRGLPAGPKAVPPRTFKIFKGGGWNQDAEFAGAANRFMMSPSQGIHFVGFRIAIGKPVESEIGIAVRQNN